MPDSKPVVLAALLANVAIGGLKFGAFLLTGSAALLSEVYHSLSDTGNQLVLLAGISYSAKEATRTHPFGYGKAQFFYSFLASVLLFGVAGWQSLTEGYHALLHTEANAGTASVLALPVLDGTVPGVVVSIGVLVGVLVFEGWSLRKAYAELARQCAAHEWNGLAEAFRRTSDATTLAAFVEDTIAVTAAGVALFGVVLAQLTGNPVYDAAAALAIGALLMIGALALAWETKRLLLGKSLPSDEERRLYAVVADHAAVADVTDFRTVLFGPERVVVTAGVSFADDLAADEIHDHAESIKSDLFATGLGVEEAYLTPGTE